MDTHTLNILANCSGKTTTALYQLYGKNTIDSLIAEGYIATLNGTVMRTELGMQLSKPMQSATNENFGKPGYQLIVESDKYTDNDQFTQ